MAQVAYPTHFGASIGLHRSVRPTAKRGPSLLRRLYDSLMLSNQRQAERDIARFLNTRGGRLTDSIERDLNDRLMGQSWNRRP